MLNFLTHKDDAKKVVEKFESVKRSYERTVDNIKTSALSLFKKRECVLDESVNMYKRFLLIEGIPSDFIKQIETQLSKQQIKRISVSDGHTINYAMPNEDDSEAWKYMFGAAGMGSGTTVASGSILTALATTFGTTGTGAAISSLSGAAATNAVLAWIGGGSIVADGGGIALGSTILGLMGPVGWGIAGLSIVGGGWSIRSKNDKIIAEYQKASREYQYHSDILRDKVRDVQVLASETDSNLSLLKRYSEQQFSNDFKSFSDSEKLKLGKMISELLFCIRHLNKAVV